MSSQLKRFGGSALKNNPILRTVERVIQNLPFVKPLAPSSSFSSTFERDKHLYGKLPKTEKRVLLRGFRSDDFVDVRYNQRLDKIRETCIKSKHIKIFPLEKHRVGVRKTMAANLHWYYEGACDIKPDDNDLASQLDGVKHRVGGKTPPINQATLQKFKWFVKDWIKDNLVPLEAETDVSVETWLKESPYPLARREELQGIYDKWYEGLLTGRDVDFERLESFIKDEFYHCPKTFRTINSRLELFKCLIGPTVHQVEKKVFKLPYFIKQIPVAERAQYIMNYLDANERVFGTDVSAWEGSMSREIMEACEIQLFDYMTKNLPTNHSFMTLYRQLLLNNKLCFSGFIAEIIARRMSGEMSTSVGNGFTNLMLILFTAWMERTTVKIVVEGDDTLFTCIKKLTDRFCRELGFNLVMEEFDAINEASFCGLIFSDVKHTIRDPIPALLKFGWCTQQYISSNDKTRMQLLRAKALSLKCEMPNCPILGPLADRMLTLTKGICVKKSIQRLARYMSLYKRNEFLDAIKDFKTTWHVPANVTPQSRFLMEKLFNIPVDAQVIIEEQLAVTELGSYNNPVLDVYIPDDNRIFWEYYARDCISSLDEDVVNRDRVSHYQTHLPLNSLSDTRKFLPSYAAQVAA